MLAAAVQAQAIPEGSGTWLTYVTAAGVGEPPQETVIVDGAALLARRAGASMGVRRVAAHRQAGHGLPDLGRGTITTGS